MRHAVPLGVPDPFLYAEENGSRHVFASSMEATRLRELGPLRRARARGVRRRRADGVGARASGSSCAARAAGRGEPRARSARPCPRTSRSGSPIGSAPTGIELDVDQELFDDRRRAKTEAQLAGMRRAQRAAEAAMDACRELLRRAEISGDELLLDGEQLTVERVKADMNVVFAAHDTTADEYIVAPGAQGAVGHDMGSGPIRPGAPLVVDIFPRDNASAGLHRHDAHVRRRRGARRRSRVAPARARRRSTRAVAEIRAGVEAARCSTSRATSSRRPASRRSARRSPARRSSTASSTGSATASASRCTRQPGMGRLGDKKLVAGDVVTSSRASTAPARRRPARGHRPRHRGRRRGPHGLSVRPRAVDRSRDERAHHAIDTMFLEERRYPPPADFAAQANAQPDIYDDPFEDVLGAGGPRAGHVVRAVHASSTSGSRRTRSGISAASSTSASTASTGTSRPAAATRSRTTGKASPKARRARSRTRTSSATSSASRTRSRSSA